MGHFVKIAGYTLHTISRYIVPALLGLIWKAFVWSMMSVFSIFIGSADAVRRISQQAEKDLYLAGMPTIYSDFVHVLFITAATGTIVLGWLVSACCVWFTMNALF